MSPSADRSELLPGPSRRRWLQGVGATLALPLLESSLPAAVRRGLETSGASSQPPRVVYMYVPNGMHMPDFRPRTIGNDFELPPILQQLAAHRGDMNVLTGLTLNGARALGDGPGDHARAVAAYLTSAHPKKSDGTDIRNGVSIDQVIARQLGDRTRLPSLEVGMEQSAAAGNCDSGYSCIYSSNLSWRDETTPAPKEANPAALFDRLFGRPASLEPLAGPDPERRRRSVLDFVQEDARRLRRGLDRADQHRLEQYLTSVRELERQMTRTDRLEGLDPDDPEYPRPAGAPRDYAEHMELMFDLMALALQTDATRIMTFMYANAGSNRSYRNLEINQGHHELSHHGNDRDKQAKISQINQFHASLFCRFLDRLAGHEVGGERLLDRTLIVYGSGISDGNAHNHDDLPILLLGGKGLGIQTGRHLKFRKETPLANLHLSVARLAGAELDQFGDGTGDLHGELLG
ncbi:MAG: DUF1552 domain-containing protein [Planctomycetota bacterium]